MVQVGRTEVVTWSQGMKSHYRHIDICLNIKKEVTGILIDSKKMAEAGSSIISFYKQKWRFGKGNMLGQNIQPWISNEFS